MLLNLPPDTRGQISDNDVKSLGQFRKVLDETFAKDLTRGAKASASNTRDGESRFAASNVIDNNRETYWSTDDEIKTPELTLDFAKATTFSVARIREYLPLGQRVEAFSLDEWQNGQWVEFAKATSIGNCRLLRFKPVTTSKVRLRITQGSACPAISELSLFLEPILRRLELGAVARQ